MTLLIHHNYTGAGGESFHHWPLAVDVCALHPESSQVAGLMAGGERCLCSSGGIAELTARVCARHLIPDHWANGDGASQSGISPSQVSSMSVNRD